MIALVALSIIKVIGVVLWSYRDYFPPNFSSDFLLGREFYFWGSYHWAFYVHIVSGPLSLALGMFLISATMRARFPALHRYVGRVQVLNVLFLVLPSGLWMSYRAMTGWLASLSFAMLSVVASACVIQGWRYAVKRKFATHQRWMERCFVLLCSAVTLRVFGGLAVWFEIESDWYYTLSSWLCWVLPLAGYEIYVRTIRPARGVR